jgi:hypothetical protein
MAASIAGTLVGIAEAAAAGPVDAASAEGQDLKM